MVQNDSLPEFPTDLVNEILGTDTPMEVNLLDPVENIDTPMEIDPSNSVENTDTPMDIDNRNAGENNTSALSEFFFNFYSLIRKNKLK